MLTGWPLARAVKAEPVSPDKLGALAHNQCVKLATAWYLVVLSAIAHVSRDSAASGFMATATATARLMTCSRSEAAVVNTRLGLGSDALTSALGGGLWPV